MYVVVITLTVIVALLLIGVVLIQKSKGGGLSSQFGGANQVMGVRRTNDFIEKTWYLAGALAILCILGVFFMPRNLIQSASRITPQAVEQTQPADFNTQLPAAAPAAETPAPEATPEAPAAE